MKPVRGGSLAEPLCATCTRPDPTFWRPCPTCDEQTRIRAGRGCVRCAIRQRLRELLGDHTGAIRPELQALYDNLAGEARPTTVQHWLANSAAADTLGELGAGAGH